MLTIPRSEMFVQDFRKVCRPNGDLVKVSPIGIGWPKVGEKVCFSSPCSCLLALGDVVDLRSDGFVVHITRYYL